MRESTIVGSVSCCANFAERFDLTARIQMRQPWPSTDRAEAKETTLNNRSRSKIDCSSLPRTTLIMLGSHPSSNDTTFAVRPDVPRSSMIHKAVRSTRDDRPITPMSGSYRQIADKFGNEDGVPVDPTLTDQYYEIYNDFEQEDEHSPTREIREKEFHDQVCRSFNGNEVSIKSQRSIPGSQNSTINSMSRTIDPRYPPNPTRSSKYITSSRTMASSSKHKTSSHASVHDSTLISLPLGHLRRLSFALDNTTLKDNPTHDAFGPLAKDKKITSLRK